MEASEKAHSTSGGTRAVKKQVWLVKSPRGRNARVVRKLTQEELCLIQEGPRKHWPALLGSEAGVHSQ